MAFGLPCKKCGFQESAHDYPGDYPGVCKSYVSIDPKGERAMWDDENTKESERQQRKYRGPAYEH